MAFPGIHLWKSVAADTVILPYQSHYFFKTPLGLPKYTVLFFFYFEHMLVIFIPDEHVEHYGFNFENSTIIRNLS